jgi:hypothetical protein
VSSPITLQIWLSLIFVSSQDENWNSEGRDSLTFGNSTKIGRGALRNYKTGVPEVLSAMAKTLVTVQGNHFKGNTIE